MAKLVEILAQKLEEWPYEAVVIAQDSDGCAHPWSGAGIVFREHTWWTSIDGKSAVKVASYDVRFDLAEDFELAKVTRAQWEAERARIAANQQATAEAREIAQGAGERFESADEMIKDIEQELADIACGKRSREDQELWDQVAIALAPAVYAECCKGMDATGYPENWREGVANDWVLTVDAFMAERAKRMKGGV